MPAQTTFTHPLDGDQYFSISWPQLNNDLQAIAQWFYSDDGSAPAVTFPMMVWADASAGYVKQRNLANDDWHVIGKMATSSPEAPAVLGQLGCYLTAGAEASNVRRVTVQVGDARGDANADAVAGKRLVWVALATSSDGAPGGTHTAAIGTAGQILQQMTTDDLLLCETDANGTLEIDVTETSTTSVWVRAWCGQGQYTELEVAFA